MRGPLVSIIMPSKNDYEMVELAIDCCFAQTHKNIELVIVRAGSALGLSRASLIIDVPANCSIGEMRNIAVRKSCGSIIAHFDDDDWSEETRLAQDVDLLRHADMVGSSLAWYVEPATKKAYVWDGSAYTGDAIAGRIPEPQLLGGTLTYRRSLFDRLGGFNAYMPHGEDGDFLRGARKIGKVGDRRDLYYVATIHQGNTCKKRPAPPVWTPVAYDLLPTEARIKP